MARYSLALTVMALALMVTHCGSPEKARQGKPVAAETAARPEVLKGFAVHGHEVRAFRPCGTDEAIWLTDRTGVLWEVHKELALGHEPYGDVFAVVEGRSVPPPQDGFGAAYSGAFEVSRVIYMAQEGFRCDLDLSQFIYSAFGNEPFWSARISAEGITLRMPGYEDRTWPGVEEVSADGRTRFIADGPSGSIRISILEEPCRDTMSGAYFAYTANMRLRDEGFTGCALRGTGQTAGGR